MFHIKQFCFSFLDLFAKLNEDRSTEKANAGDMLYETGNYASALELYSEAIGMYFENAEYYSKRAQNLIQMGYYKSALVDGCHAVALDNKCEKGYECIIRCCLVHGNIFDAEEAITKVNQINSNNDVYKRYVEQCQQLRNFDMMAKQSNIKEDFVEAGTYWILDS